MREPDWGAAYWGFRDRFPGLTVAEFGEFRYCVMRSGWKYQEKYPTGSSRMVDWGGKD